jgi:hypothetical protein
MKKINLLFYFVFLLFCLVACDTKTQEQNENNSNTGLRGLENPASGGTLHAVLVMVDARANDPISQSIRVDLTNMTQWLDVLEKRNIVKVQKTLIRGDKATLANIKKTLTSLQSSPNDMLLFYFSGHGGMENGETFINTHDDKFFFRKDLTALLQQKQGRLRIAITDACSNDIDGFVASRSLSRTSKSANGEFDEAYRKLFYQYEGLLDIAASSKGEYAFSTDDLGGFFTHYFVKEGLLKNPEGGWEAIFEKAKDRTIQMFNRMPDQDKRELAQQGINSQTPIAYQLPKTIEEIVETEDQNKIITPPVADGAIKIVNNTTKNIVFYVDNNAPDAEWRADKLQKMQVDAKQTTSITQNNATITFRKSDKDIYYDLEKGTFFFELDEHNSIDLFSEVDKTDKSYAINYNEMLSNGTWAWENTDGTEVTTDFKSTGDFVDTYNSGEITEGTWKITTENLKGTNTSLLHFTIPTEDGGKYTMTYALSTEDGASAMQLVFVRAVENGEKISYKQMLADNEDFNPVMVLYRK